MQLVIAEHDNKTLKPATLHIVSAARELGNDIHILVAGSECHAVAEQAAKIQGISKVIYVDAPAYKHALAENLAALIHSFAASYTHLLAPANTFGKNIMPRVAALLDVAQLSDVLEIISVDTFVRPLYAGNALATIQSTDSIKVITVRSTAFKIAETGEKVAAIEKIDKNFDLQLSEFVAQEFSVSKRPDLTVARRVISGGRALQSAENFKLLEPLADCLGAAIGASRAAVDAGYVPNDYQVGQTGKIVAPELYIAIGISGAIQHIAGMKASKVIVAINKDPDAPIFKIANYGLVGDLFKIIPELTEELKKVI
ncbi:MAG: FAD-binding protein [Proteobacteria bacterium]|nr:FAD-binding protein [Pseudomonadota bacterium]